MVDKEHHERSKDSKLQVLGQSSYWVVLSMKQPCLIKIYLGAHRPREPEPRDNGNERHFMLQSTKAFCLWIYWLYRANLDNQNHIADVYQSTMQNDF
jgi:hypothetical protein